MITIGSNLKTKHSIQTLFRIKSIIQIIFLKLKKNTKYLFSHKIEFYLEIQQ